MSHTTSIKIAKLNINGLTSPTIVVMLEAFLLLQEIDILLLQEVTQHILDNLSGYPTYYNVGTSMRGTAIVTRGEIQLANVTKISPGRATAATFREVWLINIYAPSSTARRQEREFFYNSEPTYLLREAPENVRMGGDFNCVLEETDSTSGYNYSPALAELVRGFTLKDSWQGDPSRRAFTHSSTSRATRINRIYATQVLLARKLGVEAVAAAFIDHLAVCYD